MDFGLGTSIANGIKEGLIGYQTMRQIRNQEEQTKRQNQLQGLLHGVQQNQQTGQMEFTPEMKQQRADEALIRGNQAAQNIATSRSSEQARQLFGGLLGPKHQIPSEMTAAELKEYMPGLIATIKQEETDLDRRKKQAQIDALTRVKPGSEFKEMPKENQIQLGVYANQKAKTQSVDNMMGSLLTQLDDPKISDEQKAVSAQEQLKLMNSQLGPDALGTGEADRVSAWLSPGINPFVGKYTLGPDIKKFREQLGNAVARNKKAMGLLDEQIKNLYQEPVKDLPGANVQPPINPKADQEKISRKGLLKTDGEKSSLNSKKYSWEE